MSRRKNSNAIRVDWRTPRWRRCHYCGMRLNVENRSIDHVVPRSQGGTDAFTNLVAACKPCNQTKADFGPMCTCWRCERARAIHHARIIADDHWDRATIMEFRNG